jgi:hypothetical protein
MAETDAERVAREDVCRGIVDDVIYQYSGHSATWEADYMEEYDGAMTAAYTAWVVGGKDNAARARKAAWHALGLGPEGQEIVE